MMHSRLADQLEETIPDNQYMFILACKQGDVKAVAFYIQSGMLANAITEQTPYGKNPLIVAVKAGHTKIVKLLIENRADINIIEPGYEQKTLLRHAIELGHTEMVKLLIDNGAVIDVEKCFRSPKNFEIVHTLLEAIKAGKGAITVAQKTPLIAAADIALALAIRTRNHQLVSFALSLGAMIDEAVLSLAAQNGSIVLFKHFIAKTANIKEGIDLNTRDQQGYTPLMHAAKRGLGDVVVFLLEQGGIEGIDLENNNQTAVMLAQSQQQPEISTFLLEKREEFAGIFEELVAIKPIAVTVQVLSQDSHENNAEQAVQKGNRAAGTDIDKHHESEAIDLVNKRASHRRSKKNNTKKVQKIQAAISGSMSLLAMAGCAALIVLGAPIEIIIGVAGVSLVLVTIGIALLISSNQSVDQSVVQSKSIERAKSKVKPAPVVVDFKPKTDQKKYASQSAQSRTMCYPSAKTTNASARKKNKR